MNSHETERVPVMESLAFVQRPTGDFFVMG